MFHIKGTVRAWMPQTSQAAEHMAVQETVAALRGHAAIYGDCGNVVADAAKDRSQLATEAYAGCIVKARQADAHASIKPGRVKVRAHVSQSADLDEYQAWLAHCNGIVDGLAKEAILLQPAPAEHDEK